MKTLLALLLLIPNVAFSSIEVAKKIFPSTVLVVAEDNDMIPIGFGSGFLVEENLIVTNHHVINGANGGYVKFINEDTIYEIEGVLALNELTDLAVLQIQPSGKIDFIKSVTQPPQIGESVFALGNPLGLEGTFSDGIVSAIRNYPDTTLFQITAPISPGNSGGPVVNKNSELVGVATSYMAEGQNLNFAVPYSYVKEILNESTKDTFLDFPNTTQETFADKESSTTESVKIAHLSEKILADLSGPKVEFSFLNKSRNTIESVHLKIVITKNNSPVDYKIQKYTNMIVEPGLAKRTYFYLDRSAVNYACEWTGGWEMGCLNIEIIDFKYKE